MSEEIKVISEDANEVIIEAVEDYIPDVSELKKLGLIVTGVIVIGGATVIILKKIKFGTKVKNVFGKIPNLFKRKNEEAEAENEVETEE